MLILCCDSPLVVVFLYVFLQHLEVFICGAGICYSILRVWVGCVQHVGCCCVAPCCPPPPSSVQKSRCDACCSCNRAVARAPKQRCENMGLSHLDVVCLSRFPHNPGLRPYLREPDIVLQITVGGEIQKVHRHVPITGLRSRNVDQRAEKRNTKEIK